MEFHSALMDLGHMSTCFPALLFQAWHELLVGKVEEVKRYEQVLQYGEPDSHNKNGLERRRERNTAGGR